MAILDRRQSNTGAASATIGYIILSIAVIPIVFYLLFRLYLWKALPRSRGTRAQQGGIPIIWPALRPFYRLSAKLGNRRAKDRLSAQPVAIDFSEPRPYLGRDIRENPRYPAHSRAASHESGRGPSTDGNHELPDRRTSTRSVMTLPAYQKQAGDDEVVIGHEGERAGVDHVVEFPEADETVETQREGEMAALYRVRLLRRELRDNVRSLRVRIVEAHENHHSRSEIRTLERTIEEEESRYAILIAEAQAATQQARSRGRSRRVSSVSYLDVGLARHDGSRVREHSPSHSQHSRQGSQLSMTYSRTGIGEGDGDDEHHHLIRSGADTGTLTPPHLARPWARSPMHSRNNSYNSLTAAWDLTGPNAPRSPLAQNIETAEMAEVDLGDRETAPPPDELLLSSVPPDYDELAENGDYGEAPPYELTSAESLDESLRRVQTRERRIPRRPVSGSAAGSLLEDRSRPGSLMMSVTNVANRWQDGTEEGDEGGSQTAATSPVLVRRPVAAAVGT